VRSTLSRRAGAALAICSLATGLTAALAPAAGAQAATQVTLLNIHDFHGRISAASPSTVAMADTLQKLRAQYGGTQGTAFLSAGDNIGASLFASSFQGDQPTIDVLNAMGLQASAVGNHEFDKGVADLTGRVVPAAKWGYLGANVVVDGTPMKGYSVVDVNGVKVGVVGAVTQETSTLVSPAGLKGVTFTDPVDAVNRVARELRDGDPANGEADVVVAEYHDGSPTSSGLAAGEAGNAAFAKIVQQTSGDVSALFTAHTHQAYTWDGPNPAGGTRPVIQTGSYGANIGRVTLSVDPATKKVTGYTQENVPVPTSATGANTGDPVVGEVKRIVDRTLAEAATVGNQPVGTVKGDITTAYSGGKRDDRMSESTLGNLVGDFLVDSVADRGGADIAFMNPGGLRAELLDDPAGTDGNVTKAEANAVLPFANTVVTTKLTGAQVKKVLEQQWQPAGAARPFLALGTNSALTWTYDPTRPVGDRITSVSLEGKPLDAGRTYSVVSQSFLAAGGDNFTEMARGTEQKDTGKIDSEAWQQYLAAHRADGLRPSYARHAVAVKNLPATVPAGDMVSFTATDLDLTSLGVPAATTVKLAFDGREHGSFRVTPGVDTTTFGAGAFPTPLDGRVEINTVIPADAAPGAHTLTLTTDTGTVVTIPLTVGGTPTGNVRSPLSSDFPSIGSLGSLGSLGS